MGANNSNHVHISQTSLQSPKSTFSKNYLKGSINNQNSLNIMINTQDAENYQSILKTPELRQNVGLKLPPRPETSIRSPISRINIRSIPHSFVSTRSTPNSKNVSPSSSLTITPSTNTSDGSIKSFTKQIDVSSRTVEKSKRISASIQSFKLNKPKKRDIEDISPETVGNESKNIESLNYRPRENDVFHRSNELKRASAKEIGKTSVKILKISKSTENFKETFANAEKNKYLANDQPTNFRIRGMKHSKARSENNYVNFKDVISEKSNSNNPGQSKEILGKTKITSRASKFT